LIDFQWRQPDVVVVGAKGMLGSKVARRMAPRAVGLTSGDLDIRDAKTVLATLERLGPAVVINAAAYTDVDACETNAQHATEVNAQGPANLAAACRELGAKLVQISTDFVFDGKSRRPYHPDDPVNPLSAYGRSKAAGEKAVRESGCDHLIVRTSWLFGTGGKNFVDSILRRAESGEPLRVVHDQVGRPTYADDLADAVARLIDCEAVGVVHFANAGQCSWYEFAGAIVHAAGHSTPVEPIRSEDLNRPAQRPAYSVLDCSDYTRLTGSHPRSWQSALQDYLEARLHCCKPDASLP
jgi:dTDP-4-dehydrorhamnose reductase